MEQTVSRKSMVLSLWQPWASAIAAGIKRIETRSWGTNFRGQLLIHATKKLVREGQEQIENVTPEEWAKFSKIGIQTGSDFPLGFVVCAVNLVEVEVSIGQGKYPEEENRWGNLQEGRFAWIFDGPPIIPGRVLPIRHGYQGLWLLERGL